MTARKAANETGMAKTTKRTVKARGNKSTSSTSTKVVRASGAPVRKAAPSVTVSTNRNADGTAKRRGRPPKNPVQQPVGRAQAYIEEPFELIDWAVIGVTVLVLLGGGFLMGRVL